MLRTIVGLLTVLMVSFPQVVVAQAITPLVSVATNKSAYVTGEQITVTTTVLDPGPPSTPVTGARVVVRIIDNSSGGVFCSSPTVTTNTSGVATFTCPTGFSAAGSYYAESQVSQPSSGSPSFSTVTDVSLDVTVTVASVNWAFTPSSAPSFAINQAISFGATVTTSGGAPATGSIYIESISGPGGFSYTNTAGNNQVSLNSSGQGTLSFQPLTTAGSYPVTVCYKQTPTSASLCSGGAVTITINSSVPVGPTQTPSPSTSTSSSTTSDGLIIECDRADSSGVVSNRCQIEDFVNQFVVLGQYGITIVVFLAALMLVYGGFEFITAGGRQSKISSGQNIITGTVIGLLISFSAYVIINFAVGAITGTKTSTNPFTAIATVFDNPKNEDVKNLVKPFSGEGAVSSSDCREAWDNSCADHILCADTADENSGAISNAQARLNTIGCGCGERDGCFGERTLTCVRRFQIANGLVPNGTLDTATSSKLNEANPVRCDGVAKPEIEATLAALPKPTANVSSVGTGSKGCCIVQNKIGGGDIPLYCINQLDRRACAALGSGAFFKSGVECAADAETNSKCGFCRTPDDFCIEEVGQYWCTTVAKTAASGSTLPITFEPGVCRGGGVCSQGCTDTLKTTF